MSPRFRSTKIDELLAEGRFERLAGGGNRHLADQFMDDARKHVTSVQALLGVGHNDLNGMLALAYDAAIKPLRAVLVNQGLRARGGEGGHVAVIQAVADQLNESGLPIGQVRSILRLRNDGEYGNQSDEIVTLENVQEALDLALKLIEGVDKVLDHMYPY